MLDFSSQFTIDFHTKSLKGKENNPGFNPFLLQQKTYLLCQNIRSVFRVLGMHNSSSNVFLGGATQHRRVSESVWWWVLRFHVEIHERVSTNSLNENQLKFIAK